MSFEDDSINLQDYVGRTLMSSDGVTEKHSSVYMAFDGELEKFFLIKETDPMNGSVSLIMEHAEYVIGLLE